MREKPPGLSAIFKRWRLSGLDLPREGKRAGGKIEIAHGHEVDPYFGGKPRQRARARREYYVSAVSASRSTPRPTRSNMRRAAHLRRRLSGRALCRPRAGGRERTPHGAEFGEATARDFRPSRCNRRWSRGSTRRARPGR